MTSSTFVDNSGAGLDGGAIDNADCDGTGTLTVNDSTFTGNNAGSIDGYGGAIAVWAGGTVTNSTFSANIAERGAAVGGDSLALVDDTFTANAGADSAIENANGISVANSILDDAPATPECSDQVTDGGYNVAADNTCFLGSTSLSNSTTIGTLTLAANGSGGPQTAAITDVELGPRSRAPSACTQTTDERGQPRPGLGYSTACDAGAYEIQKSTGYDLAGSDGGVFVFPTGQIVGLLRLAAGPRHPREERRGPGPDEQLHRLRPGRLRRRCLRLPDRPGLGLLRLAAGPRRQGQQRRRARADEQRPRL